MKILIKLLISTLSATKLFASAILESYLFEVLIPINDNYLY